MMTFFLTIMFFTLLSSMAFASGNNSTDSNAPTHQYTVLWKEPSFIPQSVHDDGKYTFIEFGKTVPPELPVFFVLAEDGSKELRNFVYEPTLNRMRVSGIFQRGELRLGNEFVHINRNPE